MLRSVFAAMLAAASLAAASQAAAAEGCQLAKIGEMKVTLVGARPLVDVLVNGQPTRFILDTGAFFTSITPAAAAQLGLKGGELDGLRVVGVGGETKVLVTHADNFGLDGVTFHKVDLLILGEGELGDHAAGLIGQNFFRDMDVEYDFPHGAVRLFAPKGCGKAVMAYWAQTYSLAALTSSNPPSAALYANVTINGRTVQAELDSGAPVSLLDIAAAARSGVTTASPGTLQAEQTGGLGKARLDTWVARFDSFKLGDEEIRNVRMAMADITEGQPQRTATGSHLSSQLVATPEMLLGEDFFAVHRIYAAHSQDKLYFTYEGGPVFRNPPLLMAPTIKLK